MEEIKFKLKPKYNFIYELFMPTGTHVKNAFVSTIIMLVLFLGLGFVDLDNSDSTVFSDYNLDLTSGIIITKQIVFVLTIIASIYFAIRLILQIMQYNRTTYTFYEDKVLYEDLFLNQKRKTLLYSNIKEVEIRRSIWDRINRRGIIILSTNAEKRVGHGMIIYSVEDVKKMYDDISTLIYAYNHNDRKRSDDVNNNESVNNIEKNAINNDYMQNNNLANNTINNNSNSATNNTDIKSEHMTTDESEKDFQDSLKN